MKRRGKCVSSRLCASLFGIALLFVMSAGSAQAQATRTWVSGVGDDANPCSRTAPCKTFAGAISKTAAGGEIDVLDPGGFGAVTITKSITISSEGFEAGVLVSGTNGIVVSTQPTDVVILRGLDFEGLGTGINGVDFIGGGTLYVEKSTIHHFTGNGINFIPNNGAAALFVNDVYVRNNGSGILTQPNSTASAKVSISRSQVFQNTAAGFRADGTGSSGGIVASITDTVSSGNGGGGIVSFSQSGSAPTKVMIFNSVSSNNSTGLNANGAAAIMRVGNSTVSGNGVGVTITNGATASTYSNNQIDDSVSPGVSLTPIPLH